ncbi:hypothetical protein ATANTOWER_012160 [Ataeniobius toweri]|uniref:Uncharacterized protein n=1 Tax=Ataeniobius toweri TaxID=208326 RepID=A0ABU7BBK8_9TELE|nr:hypothetical protein [Ataeniobius toweri]
MNSRSIKKNKKKNIIFFGCILINFKDIFEITADFGLNFKQKKENAFFYPLFKRKAADHYQSTEMNKRIRQTSESCTANIGSAKFNMKHSLKSWDLRRSLSAEPSEAPTAEDHTQASLHQHHPPLQQQRFCSILSVKHGRLRDSTKPHQTCRKAGFKIVFEIMISVNFPGRNLKELQRYKKANKPASLFLHS